MGLVPAASLLHAGCSQMIAVCGLLIAFSAFLHFIESTEVLRRGFARLLELLQSGKSNRQKRSQQQTEERVP